MKTSTVAVAAVVAALAGAARADAHVTLHPNVVPAGAYAVVDVRVPNEMDDANTTRVDLQLPDGFTSASWAPVPGWHVRVRTQKLAKPIQGENGPITTEVKEIVWTADSTGAIPPGSFQQLPLSLAMPSKAGDLTFKALQTYSNGQVVRWIGPPSSDHPAPIVHVTAPGGLVQDTAGTTAPRQPAAPASRAAAPTSSSSSGGGSSDMLSIIAVVLAALALLGVAGLVVRGGRAGARVR
jgi:uncharacterized protein YcnI